MYLIGYVLWADIYYPPAKTPPNSITPRPETPSLSDLPDYSALNWVSWLAFALLVSCLLAYEQKQKREIKDKFITDGKLMHIFYNTRLGMWSPR